MRVAFLLLASLVLVNADNEPCTSALYPHGAASGDTVQTSGDFYTTVSYSGPFLFYGSAYNSVHFGSNGPIAFGSIFNPAGGDHIADSIPYLAGFWGDVTLTDAILGQIEYRLVDTPGVEFTRTEQDLARAGFDNVNVDALIIVTFNGVQRFPASANDPQNLFQKILVLTNDCSMYSIFNYETIIWGQDSAVAVINKGGDSGVITVLPYSRNFDVRYTNMGCPGRVVHRLDDADLSQTPSAGSCPQITCILKSDANVTGYNGDVGDPSPLPPGGKYVLTKTQGDNTNPCKFRVAASVGGDGDVDWVVVNVGVHKNPNKHKRSYYFNQFGFQVVAKGQGVSGAQVITPFPHEWSTGGTSISITSDATGWTLTGVGCDYQVRVEPNSSDFAVVTLLENIPRSLAGPCGDMPIFESLLEVDEG